jgi:GNAT superfamily N-acetyltransferase
MTVVRWPDGFRIEAIQRLHPRKAFRSGEPHVDDWLATKALQQQEKRLSSTKVLMDSHDSIAGYYTLAIGQVDFSELPTDVTKKLPRRFLPIAVLAWLGVDERFQGQGLGARLFAQSLRDCYDAAQVFAYVAVIVDCLSDRAKTFYRQWDFRELPGNPNRLFLSFDELDRLMNS